MKNDARRGILLMIAATLVLAILDGCSRYLATEYNVISVVMFRYWCMAAFVILLASAGSRRSPKPQNPLRTRFRVLQVLRGLMLPLNVCMVVLSFTRLGLVETHAVLAVYPLIIAALSVPVLGEQVGWRRWLAIFVGFIGVIIILRPGGDVFGLMSLVPLGAATLFAIYALLTRLVSRGDEGLTSLFWIGVTGGVVMTAVGLFFWEPIAPFDWIWMVGTGVFGAGGHYLMIKALEAAEATTIQPFAYFQLIFASAIGVLVFNESIDPMVIAGAILIVGAGLFALWREHVRTHLNR